VLEGSFTITTDGDVLANNTEVGPITVATGKSLAWKVNTRTQAAPMALIKLAPAPIAP
jgi:hypothetical protein